MAATTTPNVLEVMTFNMLAHPYTKFNQAFHKNPDGVLETAAQRAERYLLNLQTIEARAPPVLLTQEHDVALAVTGYTTGASAYVESRTEGCSVLFRDGTPIAAAPKRCRTLDLLEGKTAVVVTVFGFATFVSLHLKGGPGSRPVKLAQLRKVLEAVEGLGPTVIGGDFNETDVSVFAELMGSADFHCVQYEGASGLGTDLMTPLALDHVYVRDVHAVSLAAVRAPANPWLPGAVIGSDHVPLVLTAMLC